MLWNIWYYHLKWREMLYLISWCYGSKNILSKIGFRNFVKIVKHYWATAALLECQNIFCTWIRVSYLSEVYSFRWLRNFLCCLHFKINFYSPAIEGVPLVRVKCLPPLPLSPFKPSQSEVSAAARNLGGDAQGGKLPHYVIFKPSIEN